MRLLALSLALCLAPVASFAGPDSLNVLFLGNSYTNFNNLPQLTFDFALNAGKQYQVQSNTPGGFTLDGHSQDPISLQMIRQGGWDFVVLQEQSQIPTIPFYRDQLMYPAAERLKDTILKYNPCARVMLFMTWGRQFGGQQCDQNMTHCSPVFVDFFHMQDSLETAYSRLADNLTAVLSPVGLAWKKVIADTNIILHDADESHPNMEGSYLAACVFNSLLWDEPTFGNPFFGPLPPHIAEYLQRVADTTVFHSGGDWHRHADSVRADFSFQMVQDTAVFINSSYSLAEATYFWDFGDGQTSIQRDPSHVYLPGQIYTVMLVVESCGKRDTFYDDVEVLASLLGDASFKELDVYPVPASGYLVVDVPQAMAASRAYVIDRQGRVVRRLGTLGSGSVSVSLAGLSPGSYFLYLATDNQNGRARFEVMPE